MTAGRVLDTRPAHRTDCKSDCSTSIRNITRTSIGLRPALLFFSFAGVNTAFSISSRKLSNGTTRAIISSGSPFAERAASRLSASKKPNCPIGQHPRILSLQIRLAQIRGGRYFSRCLNVSLHLEASEPFNIAWHVAHGASTQCSIGGGKSSPVLLQ